MSKTFGSLAAAALSLAAAAAAAETSPWYIGGYAAWGHQSNALGLSDTAAVPAALGYMSKSDDVRSLALIGGIDQPVGRQRVFGDVTLRDNRYRRNKLLDHRGHTATAGVDWQTVERVSGNVTLKSNRDLVRFSTFDQPTGQRNLVGTRQADASVRVGVVTRWTFDATAGWRDIDYSDASYDPRDYRQRNASIGARWWPGGSNQAGLALRTTEGRYPRFRRAGGAPQAEEMQRRDIELSGSMQFAGALTVFARAAHSDIEHALSPAYDFSGFTGLLRTSWQPTAKLRVSAELARDRGSDIVFALDAFGTQVESARLVSAGRLRAAWAATSKLEVNASAARSRRTVTVVNPLFGFEESGRERTTQLGIGASWTPTRTSRVGCDYGRDRRSSDTLAASRLNVTASSFTCYGQLTLQP